MALSVLRHMSRRSITSHKRFYSLWEPDYLNVGKSEIPMYPVLNIKMKSYSFPVLEKYQEHLHKIATNLDIDVEDSWPLPANVSKIKLFKENLSVVEAEYVLSMYERNTQISNLSSLVLPIFLRYLEASLPEGVNLEISEFDPEYELKRYVPDKDLLDLKSELEVMKNPDK